MIYLDRYCKGLIVRVTEPEDDARLRVELGASLGAAFVTLTQMLQVETLSNSLFIALYCFAVSVPLLSLSFMATWRPATRRGIISVFETAGQLFLGIGIFMVFCHFSILAAGLFVVVSIVGWFVVAQS